MWSLSLHSMFQEEEDLVNAHRKQVEETMDIVKEVGGALGNSSNIILPRPEFLMVFVIPTF